MPAVGLRWTPRCGSVKGRSGGVGRHDRGTLPHGALSGRPLFSSCVSDEPACDTQDRSDTDSRADRRRKVRPAGSCIIGHSRDAMAKMGRYLKAYPLDRLREYPGWDAAAIYAGDRPYLYLQENYTVTQGIFLDEDVVFDRVTPEWTTFCSVR